ncbi:MAG: ComF family protein [Chloroflexota bacterium]|nr:ComF family protein [Chloroflexota bacterium]MDE2968901.1 ComF family protein [Chloroflexota bacterium]
MPALTDIRRIAEGALDLLLPRKCVGCGGTGAFLCDVCIADAPRAADTTGIGLELVLAPFEMKGAAQTAVHRLKYNGVRGLASVMGIAMAQHLERHGVSPNLIVPVPLHPSRQRERGYNQAELLAREVGSWLKVPVDTGLLARTESAGPQARSASREERLANVAGAFRARREAIGRSIVIVDDVTTTGATLQECAAVLRQAGARRAWGLTFAREI